MTSQPAPFIDLFSTGKYARASSIYGEDGLIWVSPETENARRDVLNACVISNEKAAAIISSFRDDPSTDMGKAEVTHFTKGKAKIPSVGLSLYALMNEKEEVFATLVCQGDTVHDCLKPKDKELSPEQISTVHAFIQKESLRCAEGLSIDSCLGPDAFLRADRLIHTKRQTVQEQGKTPRIIITRENAYKQVGGEGSMAWVRPTTKEALEEALDSSMHTHIYRNKFVPNQTGCGFIQDHLAAQNPEGIPLHNFFVLKDASFNTHAVMICRGDRQIVDCVGTNDEHAEDFGNPRSLYFGRPATDKLPTIARFALKNGFHHTFGNQDALDPWRYQLVPLYSTGVLYDATGRAFDVSNLKADDVFNGDFRVDGFKGQIHVPEGFSITGDCFANNVQGGVIIGKKVHVGRSAFVSNSNTIVDDGFTTRWHAHLQGARRIPHEGYIGGNLVLSSHDHFHQIWDRLIVGGTVYVTGIDPLTDKPTSVRADTIDHANKLLDEQNQQHLARNSIKVFEEANPSVSVPKEFREQLIRSGVRLGAPIFL